MNWGHDSLMSSSGRLFNSSGHFTNDVVSGAGCCGAVVVALAAGGG